MGDDYDTLKELWQKYDPYFWDVIEGGELAVGDILWATLMDGYVALVETDGQVRALLNASDRQPIHLRDLQGKGAYRIDRPGRSGEDDRHARDEIFRRHSVAGGYVQPIWDYDLMAYGFDAHQAYQGAQNVQSSLGRFQWSSPLGVAAELVGLDESIGEGLGVAVDVAVGIGVFSWNPFAGVGTTLVSCVVATYLAPRRYSIGLAGNRVLDVPLARLGER